MAITDPIRASLGVLSMIRFFRIVSRYDEKRYGDNHRSEKLFPLARNEHFVETECSPSTSLATDMARSLHNDSYHLGSPAVFGYGRPVALRPPVAGSLPC